MLRHNSRKCFFFFFFSNFWIRQYFWKFWPKNVIFCQKITFFAFFGTFWPKFSIALPKLKIWKNRSQRSVLTWFSSHFSSFKSRLLFLACQKFFYQKSDFCRFLKKKIIIFGKIWYQKQILWLISIQEMYTYIYIRVIIRKLQLAIFFTISGFTLPLTGHV